MWREREELFFDWAARWNKLQANRRKLAKVAAPIIFVNPMDVPVLQIRREIIKPVGKSTLRGKRRKDRRRIRERARRNILSGAKANTQALERIATFDNGYNFYQALIKRGFKCIGSGAYSYVVAKGDNKRVIKIGRGFDGWMDYIRWANDKGYCGKFAPMVYSYKYFPGKESPFYVAIVERMKTTIGKNCEVDKKEVLYADFIKYSVQYKNEFAGQCLEMACPGIKPFMDDFKQKWSDENQYRLDLHAGNMMLRDDGSFAITDPICGTPANDNKNVKERFKTSLCVAA